jgi:glycosyltransferase involved in cell wall biosynthesis
MPQVWINGRFFGQRVTGVQRYAREAIRALDDLLAADGAPPAARFTVLAPRGTPVPAFRRLAVREVGRLQGHAWEQLELPWHARRGLLFSFGFTGPVLKRDQVVTVHDAAVLRVPQAFGRRFRHAYAWLVRTVAARAPLTLAVSRFSAGEAAACFGVQPARLRITSEGWQHLAHLAPDFAIVDRHGLRGRPFALAVGSPTPNKNFGAIARALALLGDEAPVCVVVGAADARVFRSAPDDVRQAGRLLAVGYVSDAELKALYLHAGCFLFPSFYEGFGIPPLEAMAHGCPVIASTAPAVREVCADAALYFEPHVPAQLALHLLEVFDDDGEGAALRARLREAGLRRAALFSWQRAASLNLAAIRELTAPRELDAAPVPHWEVPSP